MQNSDSKRKSRLSEDIELENIDIHGNQYLRPSENPNGFINPVHSSGSSPALATSSNPRKPKPPVLRLDTSNVTIGSNPRIEIDEAPKSAMLDLARTGNKGLNGWLPKEALESEVNSHKTSGSHHRNDQLRSPASMDSSQFSPQRSGLSAVSSNSNNLFYRPETRASKRHSYHSRSSDISSNSLSIPISQEPPSPVVSTHSDLVPTEHLTPPNRIESDIERPDSRNSQLKFEKSFIGGNEDFDQSPISHNIAVPMVDPLNTLLVRSSIYDDSNDESDDSRRNSDVNPEINSNYIHSAKDESLDSQDEYDFLESQKSHPVGRTLFYFDKTNRFRKFLFNQMISKHVLVIEITVTFFEVAMLIYDMDSPFESDENGTPMVYDRVCENSMIGLFSVLTLLAFCRCIAFGVFSNRTLSFAEFWTAVRRRLVRVATFFTNFNIHKSKDPQKEHNCSPGFYRVFLRTSWGRVEALSITFFWTSLIALHTKGSSRSLALIVSGLAHLRLLRVLDFIPFTRVVLSAFKFAIPLLANVLIFIGFFLVVWSIVGLETFNGSMNRRCVYGDTVTNQFCGSYLEPGTLKKLPYQYLDVINGTLHNQTTAKGYTCPVNSHCVEFRTIPGFDAFEQFSIVSFDNIFNSLEIVFIIMSNNSFTTIMYEIIDSEYLVSSLFFVTGVFVLAIWLMNLLVAVMVSCYSRVKDTMQSAMVISAPLVISLGNYGSRWKMQWDAEDQRLYHSKLNSDEEEIKIKDYVMKYTKKGKVYSFFYPFFAVFTIIDLTVQACQTPPEDNLLNWEIFLASLFDIDIVWRFFVFLPYWRTYVFSIGNAVDFLLALANTVVLCFYHDTTVYAWLTIFQLLRVYRVIGTFKYVRDFWTQVYGNFLVLANLTVFFFLTTLLCTLMSCKMLRGQFPYESDGNLNTYSFYDLASAYFAMYIVASTENWTDVLFWTLENVISPGRNVVVLACIGSLFCMWLFFANFLIFNLFIGVMSENLFGSIVNKREEQVKELAREVLKKNGASGNIESDYGGEADNDNDVKRHSWIVEQFRRLLGRKFTARDPIEASRITRNMRTAIERQFVIDFLESQENTNDSSNESSPDSSDSESNEEDSSNDRSHDSDEQIPPYSLTDNSLRDENEQKENGNSSKQVRLKDPKSSFSAVRVNQIGNSSNNNETVTQKKIKQRKSNMFLNDITNRRGDAIELHDYWRNPVFKKVLIASRWFQGLFYHYPKDFRNYLHKHIETRREEAKANSNEAYVDEMFDYNQQLMIVLQEYCKKNKNFDKPLYMFKGTNKLRRFFQRIFPSSYGLRVSGIYPKPWVGYYVRLFFTALTIILVCETCINTPLYTLMERAANPHLRWTWLHIIDVTFGIAFTIECLGKIIADGFYFTPNAYLCSLWNLLDLIVLVSIWITFVNDMYDGPLSRYVRAWMALRALRLVSLHRSSEKLFNSVFVYGFKNIFAAGIIAMSIVVPYSIWGKNIFHGRLLQCNDSNVNSLDDCVGEYDQVIYDYFTIRAPRVVQEQSYFNYNNFWSSLLIQYGVLSLEGWVDVLDAVTSITGINQQPQTYASKGNAVYPIVYDYIRALLIISMFVAVIIRNYAVTMGTAFLTEQQLAWRDLKRTFRMVSPSPLPPQYKTNSFRYHLLRAVPTWIATVELWALCFATLDLLAFFYPASVKVNFIYNLIQVGCNLVLVCLSILRLIIMQPRLFFHNWWNIYGIIVCVVLLAISINATGRPEQNALGVRNATRAMYICLLMLWIPRVEILYRFYSIGTMALSEISKLLYAWFVLFITYAIALNQSFGLTKLGTQSTWSRNFRTIPKALIVLFTMSSGEGWNQLLIDYTMEMPYCIEDSTYSECGISGLAYFLFISWNLVSMYVFANLFISLICEACWFIYRSAPVNVSERDIQLFQENWQNFDPKGRGFIKTEDIYAFLGRSRGYFSMSIYSHDSKYNVRAILNASQAQELPSDDPYKVNYKKIEEYLSDMPIDVYRERILMYALFTTHAQRLSQVIPSGRGIPFYRLMKLFPLYKDMDPAENLTIKEFISLNVDLHEVKVQLAVEFISERWLKNRERILKQQRDY